MSGRDGWWNRNERHGDPNSQGPGGIPWLVWVALGVFLVAAIIFAATGGDERPGPMDPEHSRPTPPAVIMPLNSWS